MPRDTIKRKQRDTKVRALFDRISKKNPKWRYECIIEEVADQMFLSVKTTEDIIKGRGIYAY